MVSNLIVRIVAQMRISLLLTVLLWGVVPAYARQEFLEEGPPPTTVEESPTSMDYSFAQPPKHAAQPKTLKEKLKDTTTFIRDTKLNFNTRTFYLYRDNYDSSKNEAWAIGGSLSYQSGYFLDHLSVGAAVYTSQPLYAPSGRGGTLLLESNQAGYTALGQLYGEIKLVDGAFLDLYRKEYNTPFINKHDNRMTPNTFEAYALMGTHGGEDGAPVLRYGAGYFAKEKERNDEEFEWMSRIAGASVDRGVLAAGANYSESSFPSAPLTISARTSSTSFIRRGSISTPSVSSVCFSLPSIRTSEVTATISSPARHFLPTSSASRGRSDMKEL